MEYTEIEYKPEYAGKYVAFHPKTGEVITYGAELHTSEDGDGLLEVADGINIRYKLHYFEPIRKESKMIRVLRR